MPPRNIIVIGGGILGASIAWHLAKAGASVTAYAGAPGGVATPNSFAWINANWGNPHAYFQLRRNAMAGWKKLAADVPGLTPDWNGSICYDLPPEGLESFATEHGSWGYGLERINRDTITTLEPAVANPPDWALKIAEEGMIEPVTATLALLDDAKRLGANVISGTQILSLKRQGTRITGLVTADDSIEADEVILAAGHGSVALAASVGIDLPVEAAPGLIVHTKPTAKRLNHIIVAPGMELRQSTEGRIVCAASFNGSDPGTDPMAVAQALFADVKSRLNDSDDLEFERYTIGMRPMPKDGFPIVSRAGDIEGLYIAVSHSGITLAPAIGAMTAEEVLTGRRDPLLAPYHLDRFTA